MKNENQQKIVEHFISGLAGVLGTQVSKISLEEEWSKAGPEDHKHLTLDKFLDKVKFRNPFTTVTYLVVYLLA